jgi:hypothetical protein
MDEIGYPAAAAAAALSKTEILIQNSEFSNSAFPKYPAAAFAPVFVFIQHSEFPNSAFQRYPTAAAPPAGKTGPGAAGAGGYFCRVVSFFR